ncbi:hypothetical protein FH609_015970 [Streptomyces sp. 3MP-14]|uniref:Uncharacterized protein n=1 Tax=Streptomyces mimosae TaxID=2586635 RepID=A0A5N6AAN2_9ACTN|nr:MULTISPECIES: hypothetical protein [Streptomyces]KAB8165887.1 hypothetical protein FH607_013295 [Streptomyces mimosae]KAB8176276.1 hypothetical protein FH609_015970 [Streptomyces sp. 3MP-14]
MKTTLITHSIANPRRTTLAHLTDASALAPAELAPAGAPELPASTANPRRTVLENDQEPSVAREFAAIAD